MLRNLLLLVKLFCCLSYLNAQEEYNYKLSIEGGFLPFSDDSQNIGLLLNVEPKIRILENTFLGLRIGLTLNSHTFKNNDPSQYLVDGNFDNAVFSFLPTVDYYFNHNYYRPYLGGGVGVHVLANPIEVFQTSFGPMSENVIKSNVNNRLGVLVRSGLEFSRFRAGLQYSFVPIGDIEIPTGEVIGTVGNSYIGLSFGFMIRGGKTIK